MKKASLFLMLIFLIISNNLLASSEITSKIESVIVYNDSALVSRSAKATIKKGENTLKFTGLSANLVDNSIQVGLKDPTVKILDVKVEKTYLSKQYQERARSLKEKIEKIDSEIKLLNAEMTAINNYIEFLSKLSPFTTSVKLLQSEFEGYAKFIESGIKSGHKRIAENETKLAKLKEEKTSLEKELSNIGQERKETKNIILTIKSQKEGEINIELSYLVNNAGWTSQYDIYVDTVKGLINLDVYAGIVQNTGEDWKDVRLEISTSKPAAGKLDELNPWYVDIYKPREPVFYKDLAIPKTTASERAKEDKKEPKDEEEPEIKEGLISFSFALKDTVTIPSDNQPHRVFLTSKIVDKAQKEGFLNYHAIPKLSPYVYLNSVFPNPFDFPLFAGKMNIYLDGRFVSSEQLNKTYTPKEDMFIPLGIDESIKIERKRVKKFTEYTGIVSKTEKIVYEYEITIKNGKTKDINLVVKDNYPVSLNEQIKVQLETPSEKEAEISKDGIITWKIKIEPRATKKLLLKFNIEYPKGLRITGVE